MEEDKFPKGLRVLAVDDDPLCLRLLDSLLKKCHYHVTTTNEAVEALKMLRENKNKYDLVISDVNMPDMDGFKLLELVGLEMDLPVIMLSAHSDKDLVYKGVTHGAVDYLLKPVRIEELKNIWQHVVRRKKLHPIKAREGVKSGDDQNCKGNNNKNNNNNRKRKEQDEDEEEDEDLDENEEAGGSNKKPRVVWSVELHRKFVAAVNQLGIDKAVPKKILDLMNVEGLARENVASHLQKYRLYLKRLKNVVSQQKDSSYLRMASLDSFGEFHTMNGLGSLGNTCYPQGNMLGRLNSPSGLTLRGIASSGLLQPQNTTNTIKIQPALLPQSHSSTHIGEFSSQTYNPVIIPQNQFGIQSSSINVPPLNPGCFKIPNDLASSGYPVGPTVDTQGQTNYNYGAPLVGNVNAGVFQHSDVENSAIKSNMDYLRNDNYGTLDDIMNSIKRDPNGSVLMDGEFEYDGCSLGSCF